MSSFTPGSSPYTPPFSSDGSSGLLRSGASSQNHQLSRNVKLPGSAGAPVGYFMYPQAETAEGRKDSLDPAAFRYTMTSREITG